MSGVLTDSTIVAMDKIKFKMNSLRVERNTAFNELDESKRNVKDLNERLHRLEDANNELQRQHTMTMEQNDQLENQTRSCNHRLNGFKTELEETEDALASERRQQELIHQKLVITENELCNAKSKLAAVSQMKDDLEQMTKALRQQVESDTDRITEITARLSDSLRHCHEIETRDRELQNHAHRLDQQLSESEEMTTHAETEARRYERMAQELQNQVQSLKAAAENIHNRQAQLESQVLSLTARAENAETKLEQSERSLSNAQKRADDFENKFEEEKTRRVNLSNELESAIRGMS